MMGPADGDKFCVVNETRVEERSIVKISELFRALEGSDPDKRNMVPCSLEWLQAELKKPPVTQATVRIHEGRSRYRKLKQVLKIVDSEHEGKTFIKNGILGNGQRTKVPKKKYQTPEVIHVTLSQKKKNAAVESRKSSIAEEVKFEKIDLKFLRRENMIQPGYVITLEKKAIAQHKVTQNTQEKLQDLVKKTHNKENINECDTEFIQVAPSIAKLDKGNGNDNRDANEHPNYTASSKAQVSMSCMKEKPEHRALILVNVQSCEEKIDEHPLKPQSFIMKSGLVNETKPEVAVQKLGENIIEEPVKKFNNPAETCPARNLLVFMVVLRSLFEIAELVGAVDEPKQNLVEKPIEIAGKETDEKPQENVVEIPLKKFVKKTFVEFEKNRIDKFEKNSYEKFNKNPIDKFEDNTIKKFNENPINKFGENPIEKCKDYPSDKFEENPINKCKDDPIDKFGENPIPKVEEDPIDKFEEDPIDKFEEDPIDKFEENPIDKFEENPIDKFEENPFEEPLNNPTNNSSSPDVSASSPDNGYEAVRLSPIVKKARAYKGHQNNSKSANRIVDVTTPTSRNKRPHITSVEKVNFPLFVKKFQYEEVERETLVIKRKCLDDDIESVEAIVETLEGKGDSFTLSEEVANARSDTRRYFGDNKSLSSLPKSPVQSTSSVTNGETIYVLKKKLRKIEVERDMLLKENTALKKNLKPGDDSEKQTENQMKRYNTNVMRRLKRIEGTITSLINQVPHQEEEGEEEGAKFELPVAKNTDDNEEIVILGRSCPLKAIRDAAKATSMAKRCNALIRALWTAEERLQKTVDKKTKKSPYTLVTEEEQQFLIDVCMLLQTHRRLPNVGNNDVKENCLSWISRQIKNERYLSNKTKKAAENSQKAAKSTSRRKNIIDNCETENKKQKEE